MACGEKKKSAIKKWKVGDILLFILVQVETQVIISEIPLSTAVFNNFELPTS
ncbi:hypothetical protein L323_14195 [Ruminiclostridium papyrosolvens C7]|uniref:Uncharacterized protein n=1 Tax=Ruminiclostridium papyrosolvens C7 TaxID=1330534 RepID=U4QZ87_9FIRM|nr:hypothetical protein L323_14195 [Ruminiclostridium papyrosolvens C7]